MKTLIVTVALLCSFGLTAQKEAALTLPDSTYAVIPLDTTQYFPWSIKMNSPALISTLEMLVVDSLVQRAMLDNREGRAEINRIRDEVFLKQIMPSTNPAGDKILFVNCLCSFSGSPAFYSDDPNAWKERVFVVKDGGGCFWQMMIDLSTRTYYDLYVNGY